MKTAVKQIFCVQLCASSAKIAAQLAANRTLLRNVSRLSTSGHGRRGVVKISHGPDRWAGNTFDTKEVFFLFFTIHYSGEKNKNLFLLKSSFMSLKSISKA